MQLADEMEEDAPEEADDQQSVAKHLLTKDGCFCVGPKEKIHKHLAVEAYAQLMPWIPLAELVCR